MKTPREKYQNDPQFRMLVDILESQIHQANFTPSELREAAMLASINYEMMHIRKSRFAIPPEANIAIDTLEKFVDANFPRIEPVKPVKQV